MSGWDRTHRLPSELNVYFVFEMVNNIYIFLQLSFKRVKENNSTLMHVYYYSKPTNTLFLKPCLYQILPIEKQITGMLASVKYLCRGILSTCKLVKKSYSRHNCLPKSNVNSQHANSVRAPVKLNYCICTQVQFQNSETIRETAQHKQLEKKSYHMSAPT